MLSWTGPKASLNSAEKKNSRSRENQNPVLPLVVTHFTAQSRLIRLIQNETEFKTLYFKDKVKHRF
jgi:hypothetical protein